MNDLELYVQALKMAEELNGLLTVLSPHKRLEVFSTVCGDYCAGCGCYGFCCICEDKG